MIETRVQSPTYPAISASEAIRRVEMFVAGTRKGTAVTMQEAAKAVGYDTVNGASSSVINSMRQYGLILKVAGGFVATELANRALDHSQKEGRLAALDEAAWMPSVFRSLNSQFGRHFDDNSACSALGRQGYGWKAAKRIVAMYRFVLTHHDLPSEPPIDVGSTEPPSESHPGRKDTEASSPAASVSFNVAEPGLSISITYESPRRLQETVSILESWITRQKQKAVDGNDA